MRTAHILPGVVIFGLGLAVGAAGVRLNTLRTAAEMGKPTTPSASAPAVSEAPATEKVEASKEAAALPPLALDVERTLLHNRKFHADRARAMTQEERLEYIRRRIGESDMKFWVWRQVNVFDLRQELSEYILPEDLAAVLKMANTLSSERETNRFLIELTQELAMRMPGINLSAVADSLPYTNRNQLMLAVVEDAARRDPFAALALLRDEEDDFEYRAMQGYFETAAKKDPERAFQEAGRIRSLEMRAQAYSGVMLGMAKSKDLKTAWALTDGIAEDGLRAVAQNLFLENLHESKKTKDILEFLLSTDMPDRVRDTGLRQAMVYHWSGKVPERLDLINQYVDRMQESPALKSAWTSLYGSFAGDNLDAALARAATEKGELQEIAIRVTMGKLAENDAGKALAHLDKLPVETREIAQAAVVTGMAKVSPAKAAAYLAEVGPANPQYPKMVGNLLSGWVSSDAPAASEWLDQLPPGLARDTGAQSLYPQVMGTDWDAAAVWVTQIQDPEIREKSLKNFAAYYQYYGKKEKVAPWIESSLAAGTITPEEGARLKKLIP